MAADDPPPEDRRRAERVPVNAEFQALPEVNFVRDLSERGVFLHTRDAPPVGTLVDLRFTVIAADPVVLRVKGRIVRRQTDPEGIGVEFTQVDAETRKRIAEVMSQTRPIASGPSIGPAKGDAPRRAEDLLEGANVEDPYDEDEEEVEESDTAETLLHLKAIDLEIIEDDDLPQDDAPEEPTVARRSAAAGDAARDRGKEDA